MLKEKNSPTAREAYASWRENLERQIGGIWIGMARVLCLVRDSKEIIDQDLYEPYID